MARIPSINSTGSLTDNNSGRTKRPELSSIVKESEEKWEYSLRPESLDDYIGQQVIKNNLKIAITAAKGRNDSLDHILFYGPPGTGKTSISVVLAKEMDVNIKITSAPALERPRDIIGLLISLKKGDILFIDEIHRLNHITEEILYPAMEDFCLDITIGKGQTARNKRISITRFTLIGATTKAGSLTSPLRDRFGMIHRLNFYESQELYLIILRTAKILNVKITENGAQAIAQRARGTPRIANRLLKRVRDYAQVEGTEAIDEKIAESALSLLEIDEKGLDATDRQLLRVIIENYNGGPVGIDTLSSSISEDVATIEDVYEPYLMQTGFLIRTSRGRVATPSAYEHIGIKPSLKQMELFRG